MLFDPSAPSILADETPAAHAPHERAAPPLRRPLTGVFVLLTAFWLLVLVVLPDSISSRIRSGPICRSSRWAGRRTSTRSTTICSSCQSGRHVDPRHLLPDPIHMQVFIWTMIFSAHRHRSLLHDRLSAGLLSGQGRPAATSLPTLFLLLLIPLWVSEVLRSFAWFIILALKGPLNFMLIGLGLIDQPIRWMTGFRQTRSSSASSTPMCCSCCSRSTTPSSRSTPTRSRRPKIWARPGGARTGA